MEGGFSILCRCIDLDETTPYFYVLGSKLLKACLNRCASFFSSASGLAHRFQSARSGAFSRTATVSLGGGLMLEVSECTPKGVYKRPD